LSVRVRQLPALLIVVVGGALAAGCGSDDEGDGAATSTGATAPTVATTAPTTTTPATSGGAAKKAPDAEIEGSAGQKIAAVTLELLNAENGDDPCYAIAASDWVESQGGLKGCAKKLGPIATGPLDTVTVARPLGKGETGEAQVESSDGSQRQTIRFARTYSGDWRIDGLGAP